jgi:hypothetical protein
VPIGGPDQSEYLGLFVVFSDWRCAESQAVGGLEVGTPPEYFAGNMLDLVVDDQSPLPGVEQLSVAVHPGGLVGGDRHRSNTFLAAVILADLVVGQRRLACQRLSPLCRKLPTRHQDQSLAAHRRDGGDGGDRLAAARRADVDACLLVEKGVDPRLLVFPE